MSMRFAVLGFLSEGPRHGYELRAAYEELLGGNSRTNIGQIYTTLDRAARDGLVVAEVVTQSSRPDKKVYRLTDTGREKLERWFAAPTGVDLDLRNPTFVKLMLARRVSGIEPIDVITLERREAFTTLHQVQRKRAGEAAAGDDQGSLLLLDLAVLRLEAFLEWLDRCEESITRHMP